MRPILLLEINEVPWRLLDRFRGHARLRNLERFFDQAKTYTTISSDSGDLSPWITWPSFHRGISNDEHGVRFLGQDPTTFRGTPIWDEFRSRGLSIGIGGSLQSWPPRDPGKGGFYIPDTFAQDERCIPAWVEPFQRFNLGQTATNGRVINTHSLYTLKNLGFLLHLPRLGFQPSTLAGIAKQLFSEKINRTRLARRPIFQSVLMWDIFKKLYRPGNPPAFATFFTNHVAGIMHRYWRDFFPEDFSPPPTSGLHSETMLFALQRLDLIFKDVLSFTARNPDLIIVAAASMGQGPKIWKRSEAYVMSVPQIPKLMRSCGLRDGEFTVLLAMVPQLCVQIADRAQRGTARKTLEAALTRSGKRLFEVNELNDRISISVITPWKEDLLAEGFELGGRPVTWKEAGTQIHEVDNGTGYHIPEGVMAIYGQGIQESGSREPLPATAAKKMILELAGIL